MVKLLHLNQFPFVVEESRFNEYYAVFLLPISQSCPLHITTTPSGLTLTLQFYYLRHWYIYPRCVASCCGSLDHEGEDSSVL